MSYYTFHKTVDGIEAGLALRPIATRRLKIAKVELAVGPTLYLGGGRMVEREYGAGGDIVDDVALPRGMRGIDHCADVGRQVDIGDNAFAMIQPDGDEELHVPAGIAHTIAMDLVKTVAPIEPLEDAAAVAAQRTRQGAARHGEMPQVEMFPCPPPRCPCTKVAVHHGEIVTIGGGTLAVHIHTADSHDRRIVCIALQQLLGVGEEVGVRHGIILYNDSAFFVAEKPREGIGWPGTATEIVVGIAREELGGGSTCQLTYHLAHSGKAFGVFGVRRARAVLKDIEARRRLLHDGRQHTAGEVRAIEIDKQYGGAEHDVEN